MSAEPSATTNAEPPNAGKLQNALDSLRQYALFSKLSDEDFNRVAKLLQSRKLVRGQELFQAGDADTTLYIVRKGRLIEHRIKPINGQLRDLPFQYLYPGDVFNVISFLSGTRTESLVEVAADSNVWAIPREAFQVALQRYPSMKRRLVYPTDIADVLNQPTLHKLAIFEKMTDDELERIEKIVVNVKVPQGAHLYQPGHVDTNLYLVRNGQMLVRKTSSGASDVVNAFLNAGDTFNELAFLTGRTNEDILEAAGTTNLWAIPRKPFQELLKTYPNLREHLTLTKAAADIINNVGLFDWQRPGEVVALYAKKHWWVFFRSLLPTLVCVVLMLAFALGRFFELIPTWLFLVLLAIPFVVGVAYTALQYVDWQNDFYAITDQRVLHRERVLLLYDQQNEAPIAKVQNVNITRDSFATNYFDVGDVVIETQGSYANVRFTWVEKPDRVSKAVFDQQKKLKQDDVAMERARMRELFKRAMSMNGSPINTSIEKPTEPPPDTRFTQVKNSRLFEMLRTVFPPNRVDEGNGRILYHKHWFEAVRQTAIPSILLLILLLVTVLLRVFANDIVGATLFSLPYVLLYIPVVLGLGFWFVYRYEDWRNDVYVITNDRIVEIERSPFGFNGTQQREASISSVQNVSSEEHGFWDVALNVGDVIVKTGGQDGGFTFNRVWYPRRIQREILERLEKIAQKRKEGEANTRDQSMIQWIAVYDELVQLHRGKDQNLGDRRGDGG